MKISFIGCVSGSWFAVLFGVPVDMPGLLTLFCGVLVLTKQMEWT